MEEQQSLWQFMQQQSDKLLQQTLAHIGLTFISLLLGILIAVPAGIYIARHRKAAGIVLGIAGVLQTIPSIALLGFMIPLLGIGPLPAITALFLYALLPIVRNTYTGIIGVDNSVREAAVAMGMTKTQVLFKVELPLAFPVLMAGIRTATVINVGVATLAAYIAAGGLGEFIFGGIALNNTNMIMAGAIPAALLAILLDFILSRVQKIKLKQSVALWVVPVILLLLSSFYVIPTGGNSKLLAGFVPEFMGRQDGYIGLKNFYKLNIKTVVISDAVMYKAAYEKKLDVISGYTTDGRLKAYDLVALDDNKKIFPPYYVAPVIRKEVLDKYPELEATLNLLAGKINDSIMTELNYKVDYLKQQPQQVAKDFLVSKHLYKEAQNGNKGVIKLGSKIFAEQYTLINMYAMLINGYTQLKAETKTGLGGTKICFDALANKEIDMYPEYTGTALLVLIHADKNTIASKMGNKDSAYNFVKEQFKKEYNLQWLQPVGFNNAYALMMRRQQAQQLKIKSISDLSSYINMR